MSAKLTLSPATDSQETSDWTLLTAASLGKQIGVLTERYRSNDDKLSSVRAIEARLEDLLLFSSENLTYELLQLTLAVAALH